MFCCARAEEELLQVARVCLCVCRCGFRLPPLKTRRWLCVGRTEACVVLVLVLVLLLVVLVLLAPRGAAFNRPPVTGRMRRSGSEGSLVDLDFLPSRKATKNCDKRECDLSTGHMTNEELDRGQCANIPSILEPTGNPGSSRTHQDLNREQSVSAENLSHLETLDPGLLSVGGLSQSCRAYSDGQLAQSVEGGSDQEEDKPPSPSTSCSPFPLKFHQRHQHRDKLSAAKLHLKSLFGQAHHSSNSNLTSTEQTDSPAERRSRLLFMRQWSQVGHSRKKVSRHELEKWAESIDALLASQNGVAVFEAFLRSEFSEENLLFYLACDQYKHSSNNFSLQRRAKHIYNTYIQPGAPREVNLDSRTRELTVQLLQAPSHSSLSHAQKRIYSLLDLGCYPRFLQSSTYLSLLHSAD